MMDFLTVGIDDRRQGDEVSQLRAALAYSASSWIPRMLSGGYKQFNTWRCADVFGGRARKNGSLVIELAGHKAGIWHDFATGEGGDAIDLIMKSHGCDFVHALDVARQLVGLTGPAPAGFRPSTVKATHTPEQMKRIITNIFHEARDVHQTDIVAKYLASRRLDLLNVRPDQIRQHDRLLHSPSKRHFPAMVAAIRDNAGNLIGVHRTYLSIDGRKAPVEPVKMILGASAGGHVHLANIRNGSLGVCEGIETGLSVGVIMRHRVSVWPLLSTSGFVNFKIPAGLEELHIFRDAGDAGHVAASKLAGRAAQEGVKKVYVLQPKGGDDFNSDLMGGAQ